MEKYINSFELKVGDCLYYANNITREIGKAIIEHIKVKVFYTENDTYVSRTFVTIIDEDNKKHYIYLTNMRDERDVPYFYDSEDAYWNILPF